MGAKKYVLVYRLRRGVSTELKLGSKLGEMMVQ